LFQRISPAVVSISAFFIDHFSVQERLKVSSGTGFIVEHSGFVLTNSHVVFGKKAIKVQLSDGREFPAILVGADPLIDIAVIKIGVPGNRLPTIALSDWEALKIGNDVIAIGYPLGFDQTLTRGVISAVNRILPTSPMSLKIPMLQTDASINPGNSGGPLVDSCGRVVGVNTSVIYGAENIGFAIPAPIAKQAYLELIKHNRIIRPWVGVNGRLIKKIEVQSLLKVDVVDGFMIETIEPDSPAEDIGLVGGILQIQVAGEYYLFGKVMGLQ
jgi:serine protease Do